MSFTHKAGRDNLTILVKWHAGGKSRYVFALNQRL